MTPERPILFSGPMVRAILEDRKTQTRRAIGALSKRFPFQNLGRFGAPYSGEMDDPYSWGWPYAEDGSHMSLSQWMTNCPYGVPGDRLWVKETYAIVEVDGSRVYLARAERMPAGKTLADTDGGLEEFRVSPEIAAWARERVDRERWKPSIFMPRWATRILLEVLSVRAERLQSISIGDCFREGVDDRGILAADPAHLGWARDEYISIWETINGQGSWVKNPWVWVVEFKKIPSKEWDL